MNTDSPSAEEIALFLQERPEFFSEHAQLFANLRVPHPHEARAISLGERQIMTLRARTRDLEWRLTGLINNASGNEKIGNTLNAWCRRMLAEQDPGRLPTLVVDGLSELFELPTVALRLWDLPALGDSPYLDGAGDSIRRYAEGLEKPYCGPMKDREAARWLPEPPASLAMIALRPRATAAAFGLLVLASPDVDRFTADMGTTFLETLGGLAGAALSRLQDQAESPGPASA